MDFWWGWRKALFGKVDQDYRQAFLREDINLVRIVVTIAAIWAFGFIYVEYLALGWSPLFFLLGLLRFLFISASIGLFIKLPKLTNLDMVDFAVFAWGIACVLLVYTSNRMRNDISIKNINTNLAIILGFYLIVPNRQLYKTIPVLFVTMISLYILCISSGTNFGELTQPIILSYISAIVVMDVVGFLTSVRFDAQRRQQYLIQKTLIEGRAQLKQLAATDSLTGIPNRRGFFEAAEIQFDRFKRYKERFAFAIIDIDNLKRINDTYGHPAGDHSILLLTDTILAEKRSSDMIGRLAGDEFGIVLPNTSAGRTLDVLTRMQEVLQDSIVESSNNRQFQVSFSAGITEVKKTDETFDDLYRRADKALLAAKQAGRNRIEIS